MFEWRRARSRLLMTDVYDSPRWRHKVGAPTSTLKRIGVQYCVDGVTICNIRKQAGSFKPAMIANLSLPPWLRYKSRHLIVQMLIDASLKYKQAAKYYDWAAQYEMNTLHSHGVNGVRVILFGVTLDAPGRRELLNMQSVAAFFPCPHCLYTAQPGRTKQCFGGYRQFLAMDSPWRQRRFVYKGHTYEFRDVEEREPAVLRTDDNVAAMVRLARPNKPFCGHKGPSFLHKWTGADWGRSMCDEMHDKKAVCEMLLKGLVGKGRDGMYKSWQSLKKDIKHRKDCEIYEIFEDFVNDPESLPPWRLSREAVGILDMRVRGMWWPHYIDILAKDGHSFWTHSDRMYKCANKSYVLMVLLPTCLCGFVPAVHQAILLIVNALRHLAGQVFSKYEATSRSVFPGSHAIDKNSIGYWGKQLIRGFVLLEGSFPVGHLNPNMHHLVHYALQTARAGLLRWVAMWSFERKNNELKKLIRNKQQPLATLANNVQMKIATRILVYTERSAEAFEETAPTCFLCGRNRPYTLSAEERFQLGMLGVTSSLHHVRGFDIAKVLGVHFKAGEWGKRRCGSVIVTMRGGCSRYCIVKKFVQVQGKCFARVIWLSKPEYPYTPNRLVVRVRMTPHVEETIIDPHFISIDGIDPCTVSVMPDIDGVHYFLMRGAGYDRVRNQ